MELSKVGLLLIKAESSYGVDSVPLAASNVIAAMRGEVTLDDMGNPIIRQILDGGFNEVAGVKTELAWSWKFKSEIRGNRTDGIVADISAGAAAQKLEIDSLLQACDLIPTYTAESGVGARDGCVIYKPTIPSGQGQSVSAYFYSQAKVYKLLGGKGDVGIGVESGKFGYFDWEFKGKFVPPSDSSIPGSPAFLGTMPPLLSNPQAWTAQAVTVTSATPGVVTLNAHGLGNGDRVRFAGAPVPTGITAGQWYFVNVLTANTFKLSLAQGGGGTGTYVATSSAGTSVTMDSAPSMVWDTWTGGIFTKADVKLGNSIAMRGSANHQYGVQGFINTGRSASAGLDPESVPEATHPIWADSTSQRSKPLLIQLGAQSGNRMAMDFKTLIQKPSYGDNNGRRIQNVALKICQDAVGQVDGSDFKLTFF
jgi:hypothetical protein